MFGISCISEFLERMILESSRKGRPAVLYARFQALCESRTGRGDPSWMT
jgi:hypothetical protein